MSELNVRLFIATYGDDGTAAADDFREKIIEAAAT